MGKQYGYYVDLSGVAFDEMTSWLHAMPFGTFQHSTYGELNFDTGKVKGFADSVKNKVRGIDLDVDYDHKAKTHEAAGWVKDADVRSDGLWLLVDWTKEAAQKIKDKKYKYFSPEFHDEWTDAQGKMHQNVLFGGGLTNRPFLKNLVPVNLSELSFVEPSQEEGMDPKKLRELLGLAADATDEQVATKLSENKTTIEVLQAAVQQQTTQLAEFKTEIEQIKNAPPKPSGPAISDTLKQLAESNPVVKALVDQVEGTNKELAETQKVLRETRTAQKLTELDGGSKMILTPRAKELAARVLNECPAHLTESVWELLGLFRKGTSAMVELGERAGASVHYGTERTSTEQFTSFVAALQKDNPKLSEREAMDMAAAQHPEVYNQYREDSYSFRA